MKPKIFLWMAVLGMAVLSCSKDGSPEISYENTIHTLNFDGTLPIMPEKARGMFTIDPETFSSITIGHKNAITIDNDTGELTLMGKWLPPDELTVTVNTIEDDHERSVDLTVTNRFRGKFTGNFNSTPGIDPETLVDPMSPAYLELTFENADDGVDDTGALTADYSITGSSGEGTWTVAVDEDGVVSVQFTFSFDGISEEYFYDGILSYDNDDQTPYIAGYWYFTDNLGPGNEQGSFRVDFAPQ